MRPIFECGMEQRSDLNNNIWLDFLIARAYVASTKAVVYLVHLAAFGTCIRFKIKISNKFFEKILGEWTISKVGKTVIKFGEKGKRQGKRAKS